MKYTTQSLANDLKAARKAKGLSQRELSLKSGVPQSHISKIESGAVDLRLTSLIELARILDLEVMLVPRKSVPAVQSIARLGGKTAANVHGVRETQGDPTHHTESDLWPRPAYSLDDDEYG